MARPGRRSRCTRCTTRWMSPATLLELSGGTRPDAMGRAVIPRPPLWTRENSPGRRLPCSDTRSMDRAEVSSFRRMDLHPDVPRQLPRVPRCHAVRPLMRIHTRSTTCRSLDPMSSRWAHDSWRIGRTSAVADSATRRGSAGHCARRGRPLARPLAARRVRHVAGETGRATWVSRAQVD